MNDRKCTSDLVSVDIPWHALETQHIIYKTPNRILVLIILK